LYCSWNHFVQPRFRSPQASRIPTAEQSILCECATKLGKWSTGGQRAPNARARPSRKRRFTRYSSSLITVARVACPMTRSGLELGHSSTYVARQVDRHATAPNRASRPSNASIRRDRSPRAGTSRARRRCRFPERACLFASPSPLRSAAVAPRPDSSCIRPPSSCPAHDRSCAKRRRLAPTIERHRPTPQTSGLLRFALGFMTARRRVAV
jgi:hypothetical protein